MDEKRVISNSENGHSLPNGLRELTEKERNPKPSPEPYMKEKAASGAKVIRDHLGRRLCGAKCRGKDKRCRQPALQNGRCRLHGGLTPGGMASPHYKHGMRSKYLRDFPPLPPPPPEKRQLASADLDTTLLRDELAGIRERFGAVKDDPATRGDRLWKKTCEEVAKETRCSREAKEKLLALPALLPGVDVQELCSAILEATANVLKEHYGPKQMSDVFLLFCDRMECIWYGEHVNALKHPRRR
jgi:hypothetical protein